MAILFKSESDCRCGVSNGILALEADADACPAGLVSTLGAFGIGFRNLLVLLVLATIRIQPPSTVSHSTGDEDSVNCSGCKNRSDYKILLCIPATPNDSIGNLYWNHKLTLPSLFPVHILALTSVLFLISVFFVRPDR